jgi:hypothetical protein
VVNEQAPDQLAARLIEIVRSSRLLMEALRAAREVDPPEWAIGAGAVRDLVLDRLHGAAVPIAPKDIDLIFFEPVDPEGDSGERQVLEHLNALEPDLSWDVSNQAVVHRWYPERFGIEVEPLRSCADAVATWPETASAVAVRLLADDRIEVIAPLGLHDLFDLV